MDNALRHKRQRDGDDVEVRVYRDVVLVLPRDERFEIERGLERLVFIPPLKYVALLGRSGNSLRRRNAALYRLGTPMLSVRKIGDLHRVLGDPLKVRIDIDVCLLFRRKICLKVEKLRSVTLFVVPTGKAVARFARLIGDRGCRIVTHHLRPSQLAVDIVEDLDDLLKPRIDGRLRRLVRLSEITPEIERRFARRVRKPADERVAVLVGIRIIGLRRVVCDRLGVRDLSVHAVMQKYVGDLIKTGVDRNGIPWG